MGRDNKDRQQATLPFKGKPVKLYRPTNGQAMAIYMSAQNNKGSGGQAALRFFRVIESLVVEPADWTRMEELMIVGEAAVEEFSELFGELSNYDWPEESPADGE